MLKKITVGCFLIFVIMVMGCQSNVSNLPISPNSEAGREISKIDDAKLRYQTNVEIYKKAMADYETAQGSDCGHIMFSSVVGPLEKPAPRVRIYKLQGSSRRCGYQNYRTRIFYADDECLIVTKVEILERMAGST